MAKQKSPGLPMFNDEQRAQMERWVIENFGGPFTSAPSRRYVDFESGLHGLRLNKAPWQLIGRRARRRWPPYAWQGGPIALFAARRRVHEAIDEIPEAQRASLHDIVLGILRQERPPDDQAGFKMPETLLVFALLSVFALEQAEEDDEAPLWIKWYLGEEDLDVIFRRNVAGIC